MVLEGRTLNEIRIIRQQLGSWQYCLPLNVQGECMGSVTSCFCCLLQSTASQFCLQGCSSLCHFAFYSVPEVHFWNAGRVTFVTAVRNISAWNVPLVHCCAKTLSWRFKKLGSDMCFWVWSSQQMKLSIKNIHSSIPRHTIISHPCSSKPCVPLIMTNSLWPLAIHRLSTVLFNLLIKFSPMPTSWSILLIFSVFFNFFFLLSEIFIVKFFHLIG